MFAATYHHKSKQLLYFLIAQRSPESMKISVCSTSEPSQRNFISPCKQSISIQLSPRKINPSPTAPQILFNLSIRHVELEQIKIQNCSYICFDCCGVESFLPFLTQFLLRRLRLRENSAILNIFIHNALIYRLLFS